MKKIFLTSILVYASVLLRAQYYYQDIIGTEDLNRTIQLYLKNKVLSAEAVGFDAEGVQNSDFSETHDLFPDQRVLKIAIRNKTDISAGYYRFNSKGLLTSVSDTAAPMISTTSYTYDEKNEPETITNVVNDAHDSVYEHEVHQWFYNADGKPLHMLRIVNRIDTTDVRFTLDDKGNVIDELPIHHNVNGEKIYYYYDAKNRLTDIVRFNAKAHRLLPDYTFEYSEQNEVIQKITTLSAADVGYLTWRYAYDDRGLKTTEASFNRNKELTGKIKYSYQFEQ